jgi:hypothetical protein
MEFEVIKEANTIQKKSITLHWITIKMQWGHISNYPDTTHGMIKYVKVLTLCKTLIWEESARHPAGKALPREIFSQVQSPRHSEITVAMDCVGYRLLLKLAENLVLCKEVWLWQLLPRFQRKPWEGRQVWQGQSPHRQSLRGRCGKLWKWVLRCTGPQDTGGDNNVKCLLRKTSGTEYNHPKRMVKWATTGKALGLGLPKTLELPSWHHTTWVLDAAWSYSI